MRRCTIRSVRAAALALLSLPLAASAQGGPTQLPKSLVEFAETVLADFGKNPVIVRSVETQNARPVPLERIRQIDKAWTATPGIDAFMWELMRNRSAYELVDFQQRHRFVVEAFVMDARGALVAMTGKASRYWQGEEPDFSEGYRGGRGGIHYGAVRYNADADDILVRISVPVMRAGRAIGVVAFGISLDRWERR